MAVSRLQLNRFERILCACAIALAGFLIVIRVGTVLFLTFLHHAR